MRNMQYGFINYWIRVKDKNNYVFNSNPIKVEAKTGAQRIVERGKGAAVIEEIVLQSHVEFNVEEEEQDILIQEEE